MENGKQTNSKKRRERRNEAKEKLGYAYKTRFEDETKKRNVHERFEDLFALCEKHIAANKK